MKFNLTLQQLEAFSEVAKTANFREAAKNLNVSQPALSRTIKMVEDALGTRLFDRDTRHVELTSAGLELLPIARRVLHDFNSSLSELGQFMDGRKGHVSFIALPSASAGILTPAVSSFHQKHPAVQFSILEGQDQELREAVIDGRAEFGVSTRPKQKEHFRYTHLVDDPFIMLCRVDDSLAQRSSAQWSDFSKRKFLTAAPSSSIRPITDAVFQRNGQAVPDGMEYPSIPTAAAMVRAGLGVTAVPKLSLGLLDMNGIRAVALRNPVMTRPIGIITRIGRALSPATKAFLEEVQVVVNQGNY